MPNRIDHGSNYTPIYSQFQSLEVNRGASMDREDQSRQRRFLYGSTPYAFSGLAASVTGTGLGVQIATGDGMDGNGYPIFIPPAIPNSKTLLTPAQAAEGIAPTVMLAAANPSNPRIDLVCLRTATLLTDYISLTVSTDNGVTKTNQVNPQTSMNYFTIGMVTGTPNASPVAPAALLATDLVIAQVLVPAAAVTLVAGNVTDVRPLFAGFASPTSATAALASAIDQARLIAYIGY